MDFNVDIHHKSMKDRIRNRRTRTGSPPGSEEARNMRHRSPRITMQFSQRRDQLGISTDPFQNPREMGPQLHASIVNVLFLKVGQHCIKVLRLLDSKYQFSNEIMVSSFDIDEQSAVG